MVNEVKVLSARNPRKTRRKQKTTGLSVRVGKKTFQCSNWSTDDGFLVLVLKNGDVGHYRLDAMDGFTVRDRRQKQMENTGISSENRRSIQAYVNEPTIVPETIVYRNVKPVPNINPRELEHVMGMGER